MLNQSIIKGPQSSQSHTHGREQGEEAELHPTSVPAPAPALPLPQAQQGTGDSNININQSINQSKSAKSHTSTRARAHSPASTSSLADAFGVSSLNFPAAFTPATSKCIHSLSTVSSPPPLRSYPFYFYPLYALCIQTNRL